MFVHFMTEHNINIFNARTTIWLRFFFSSSWAYLGLLMRSSTFPFGISTGFSTPNKLRSVFTLPLVVSVSLHSPVPTHISVHVPGAAAALRSPVIRPNLKLFASFVIFRTENRDIGVYLSKTPDFFSSVLAVAQVSPPVHAFYFLLAYPVQGSQSY